MKQKNFSLVKNTLDFCEELEYIGVCLWEGIKIIESLAIEKIFARKKCPIS